MVCENELLAWRELQKRLEQAEADLSTAERNVEEAEIVVLQAKCELYRCIHFEEVGTVKRSRCISKAAGRDADALEALAKAKEERGRVMDRFHEAQEDEDAAYEVWCNCMPDLPPIPDPNPPPPSPP